MFRKVFQQTMTKLDQEQHKIESVFDELIRFLNMMLNKDIKYNNNNNSNSNSNNNNNKI